MTKHTVWPVRFLIILITFIVIFPFILVVLNSFKVGESIYNASIIPTEYTLDHYADIFTGTAFPSWIRNSLYMGVSAGIIAVIVTMFGGYAFSRFHFRGKKYGITFLLIVQMLPVSVAMVAYFKMLQIVGLLNSLNGIVLILGFGNSAIGIWLMRNYMNAIPKELDESAYIDGASRWKTYWKILFPLMLPMLVTQFIMTFIGVYNEYMLSAILLFDPGKYPLGVGLKSFMAGNYAGKWATFSAASVLGSVPILIIFYSLQKYIVNGLTKGAVKH
jgi:arabinogalactan oligomer/maltooligosaccharide transport system permease protein